ncbi:asparagine synthase-related protein [Halomonas sp. C05BenzN]|uniref:asparagine synthase-related protein n=1 Tax=Halomonas sp. C05BenzN TaxID=3411041 RepID=UPI003B9287E8
MHCHFTSPRWQASELPGGHGHLCGIAWRGAARLGPADLGELVDPAVDPGRWRARLADLNGFHALVRHDASALVAAVDRIRSIPLYYGVADGRLYLSDDADWVRRQVGEETMSEAACTDFALAGYVTGRDTLYRRVKQLLAGEALVARDTDTGLSISLERYYRFSHAEVPGRGDAERQAALGEVTEAAFRRLVEVADGRQIVVPLSGGHDSRLVATMLARLDYPRVLTYAYGHRGNREAEVSREVAARLGLAWTFVEYSETAWQAVAATRAYWDYQQWASGWHSIANMQDWLAVKRLTERGEVESGALFVPGHCCVTGFVPPALFAAERESRTLAAGELAEALRDRHFVLRQGEGSQACFHDQVLPRLAGSYPLDEALSADAFLQAFVLFGWQERQAKFIVNTVRSFEYFGHDWWMPLYDREFMAFWQHVPLRWLDGRQAYVAFVDREFAAVSGIDTPLGNAAQQSRRSLRARLTRLAAFRRGPGARVKRAVKRLVPGLARGNTLASGGRFPPETLERLRARGYSHNGVAAQLFLERFS